MYVAWNSNPRGLDCFLKGLATLACDPYRKVYLNTRNVCSVELESECFSLLREGSDYFGVQFEEKDLLESAVCFAEDVIYRNPWKYHFLW